MSVMMTQGSSNLADILDRVLDKGLMIEAWARISLVQLELLTVEARIMASSVDTYLQYAAAIGLGTGASEELTAGARRAALVGA
jgi:hypothetical protein